MPALRVLTPMVAILPVLPDTSRFLDETWPALLHGVKPEKKFSAGSRARLTRTSDGNGTTVRTVYGCQPPLVEWRCLSPRRSHPSYEPRSFYQVLLSWRVRVRGPRAATTADDVMKKNSTL